ncbi:MAG: hypothetical protein LC799_20695, partial [Actinobacteria bacterium]|nr:hypothetical protein [Actinomycetota bacterium]
MATPPSRRGVRPPGCAMTNSRSREITRAAHPDGDLVRAPPDVGKGWSGDATCVTVWMYGRRVVAAPEARAASAPPAAPQR